MVRHTDAEHTLSTAELMKILREEYAVKVSRNTISDDLAMLHDCGLNIEHYESTQNKYYYDGQTFDLAELKVLVDAISASKFITQRKCDELITKLLTLTTAENEQKLRRHIIVGQFRMFDTDEPVDVELLCHPSVMKYLIDNFGTDFRTEPVDDEHFKATVNVCTSTTFYRWVFGFNGKIRILGPQEIAAEYREMLQKALSEE